MGHCVEPASSGRAKCRGCGQPIAKGELRFGERTANPFGEGEMTLWFHPACAALVRPEPFLEMVNDGEAAGVEGLDTLKAWAEFGLEHRRIPRIIGGQRSPTSRAKCRACREPIEKDTWRIALGFFEDGRMNPGGFIHDSCAEDYFETGADLLVRIRHFSPDYQQ